MSDIETVVSMLRLPVPHARTYFSPGIVHSGRTDVLEAVPLKSMILCTARSGSSLLAVALNAYGFKFEEYLNPNGGLKRMLAEGKTTVELAAALKKSACRDGRISIKGAPGILPFMFLIGEFPFALRDWKFVYLRRQNVVRQAISSIIAAKTGKWTHVMQAKGQVSGDDYDYEKISNSVIGLTHTNSIIERFIGLFDLNVKSVIYEEFIADQTRQLADIARFFGVDQEAYPDAAATKPWIEKQATELNDDWEKRFREDTIARMALRP